MVIKRAVWCDIKLLICPIAVDYSVYMCVLPYFADLWFLGLHILTDNYIGNFLIKP